MAVLSRTSLRPAAAMSKEEFPVSSEDPLKPRSPDR